jgi:two-component system response regulator YesN
LRPNFQVITALNGNIAWEKIQQESFCLLLTDYAMPDMDGLELAQRVRNLRPEASIVLMTGGIQLDMAAKAQEFSLAGYLNKPFAKTDIQNLLERLGF